MPLPKTVRARGLVTDIVMGRVVIGELYLWGQLGVKKPSRVRQGVGT